MNVGIKVNFESKKFSIAMENLEKTMRRDINLIKLLLSQIEQETEETTTELAEYQPNEINYNLYLLIDGGYIEGNVVLQNGEIYSVITEKMTWKGHELLDSLNGEPTLDKMENTMKEALTLGFEE